jgi:hypothetical protein
MREKCIGMVMKDREFCKSPMKWRGICIGMVMKDRVFSIGMVMKEGDPCLNWKGYERQRSLESELEWV